MRKVERPGVKPKHARSMRKLQKTLVPLHGDFDRLDCGHSNSGRFVGSTSTSMLRATLGCRLMKPARSSVSTIW
jgi:hypothetical protein